MFVIIDELNDTYYFYYIEMLNITSHHLFQFKGVPVLSFQVFIIIFQFQFFLIYFLRSKFEVTKFENIFWGRGYIFSKVVGRPGFTYSLSLL